MQKSLSLGNPEASSQGVPLSGWLRKRGQDPFKGWKKRFFRQSGVKLYYFSKETDTNPLGFIDLSQVEAIHIPSPKKHSFDIVTPNRTYHLATLKDSSGNYSFAEENKADFNYWVQGFSRWIENSKKQNAHNTGNMKKSLYSSLNNFSAKRFSTDLPSSGKIPTFDDKTLISPSESVKMNQQPSNECEQVVDVEEEKQEQQEQLEKAKRESVESDNSLSSHSSSFEDSFIKEKKSSTLNSLLDSLERVRNSTGEATEQS